MEDEKENITTLEPHEIPSAQAIIREMRDAIIAATSLGIFERLKRCHETTKCTRRDGNHDGRLGKPSSFDKEKSLLFRWPGAPDMSVPLADTVIRWLVMIRMSVFNRGDSRVGPERIAPDEAAQDIATEKAGMWQNTVEFFLNKQDWMFSKAYGLFSTCVEEFGFGIMIADWQKKKRNELCRISLQQLADAIIQKIMEASEAAGDVVDVEALGQRVQTQLANILAIGGDPPPDIILVVTKAIPGISEKEAKRVIKQFSKDPSQDAEYIMQQDDGGLPVMKARIPYVSCLTPHDMTGDGQADWIAIPEYYSRSSIQETSKIEGWNEALTKQVIENQANKFFYEWFGSVGVSVPDWALNGMGIALSPDKNAMEESPRWMLMRLYRKIADENGLPMVYRGVVHPFVEEGMLLWEPTDLREIPIVVETSEDVEYAVQARGVPDIVVDKQNYIRDSINSEGARGQLGSNPPFVRAQGVHVGVRPGLELDGGRGRVTFADSEFLSVPKVDEGTFALMDRAEMYVRNYYFCHKETPPDDRKLFMENQGYRSLRCVTKVIQLIWSLIQSNVDSLQVSNIAGRAVILDVQSRDQLAGEVDVSVGFHMDGFSEDAADKFFKLAQQLLQSDQAGRIDKGALSEIMVQLMAPAYARRLIVPGEQAAAQVINDQDSRISKIVAGVPMEYLENVSAPQARLDRVQQWLANPDNLALASSSETRQGLVQKEVDYLTFAIGQQTTNPTAGRTGVKPN